MASPPLRFTVSHSSSGMILSIWFFKSWDTISPPQVPKPTPRFSNSCKIFSAGTLSLPSTWMHQTKPGSTVIITATAPRAQTRNFRCRSLGTSRGSPVSLASMTVPKDRSVSSSARCRSRRRTEKRQVNGSGRCKSQKNTPSRTRRLRTCSGAAAVTVRQTLPRRCRIQLVMGSPPAVTPHRPHCRRP